MTPTAAHLSADSQCPPLPPSLNATTGLRPDEADAVAGVLRQHAKQPAAEPLGAISPEDAYELLFGGDFASPGDEDVADGSSNRGGDTGRRAPARPAHFPPSARHGTFLRISERELLALVGRFGIGVGPGHREAGARAAMRGFGGGGSTTAAEPSSSAR